MVVKSDDVVHNKDVSVCYCFTINYILFVRNTGANMQITFLDIPVRVHNQRRYSSENEMFGKCQL